MDRISLYVLTLLSLLSVYISYHPVHGKCKGAWQNYHGCLGGNGKRSGPGSEIAGEDALDNSRLLERLLSGDLSAFRADSDITMAAPAIPGHPRKRADYGSSSSDSLENYLRKIVSRLEDRYDNK